MESVSEGGEGGEGREGSEVKRGARVILYYINRERFFDIHDSVSPLFKGGWLDFAQDGKLNFLSKIQLSEKSGQLSIWNRNNIQSKIPVHKNNWVS